MAKFTARRVRFQNGERHSVLISPRGLPVHEVTIFLATFRRRGRAANTIHSVCTVMALLYSEMERAGIDLLDRLRKAQFLTIPELNRLADAAQYRAHDLFTEENESIVHSNIIDLKRIRKRRKSPIDASKPIDVATHASRIRYMATYFDFLSTYYAAALPAPQRRELTLESSIALKAFRAQIPKVSKRAKVGSREGLSPDDQKRLLNVVNPSSPDNPWNHAFAIHRNWLIVVILLATGMRRGELLGLQVGDLDQRLPQIRILRRADAIEDPRRIQANTKTNDRIVELRPAIMKAVWTYIRDYRNKIKAARKFPQLIVANDGQPLSLKSIDKIFSQLRAACPDLPVRLSSHVMRHTWNERFSEQAEELGLSDTVEEKARNEQQGWADNSKSAATYTRRYANRKGRELALRLQEKLDVESN